MIYLRKTAFAFFDISLSHFSLLFLVLRSFQLFSIVHFLGLWIVSLFLKFVLYFDFVCCAGLLFLMFQNADARNMTPYWRIYCVFYSIFFAFEQYYYIKLYQLYFSNNENKYFHYIIIINYKKITVNAYTYSYKIVVNNILFLNPHSIHITVNLCSIYIIVYFCS